LSAHSFKRIDEGGLSILLRSTGGRITGLSFLPPGEPRVLPRIARGDSLVLRTAAKELSAYLRGQPVRWSFPLEPLIGTEWQKAVWKALSSIPYGQVRTYGEIAESLGSPRSARSVGGACGANPLPIIVPCHRVVGARGQLGGFSSGIATKRKLLKLEQSGSQTGRLR